MTNPFQTRFGVIFWNEVLLNSKRVAPYALMIIFSPTALMGWRKGPAVALGWATNSALSVRSLLLYHRNAHAELQDRLRPGSLLLSALHNVWAFLTQGSDGQCERLSRSLSA